MCLTCFYELQKENFITQGDLPKVNLTFTPGSDAVVCCCSLDSTECSCFSLEASSGDWSPLDEPCLFISFCCLR